MKKDKIKFKLSADQYQLIHNLVLSRASSNIVNTMDDKLIRAILIQLFKKLQPKLFVQNDITVTLTAAEAIAFWLAFNNRDYRDPFQMATMRNILDTIHKTYC